MFSSSNSSKKITESVTGSNEESTTKKSETEKVTKDTEITKASVEPIEVSESTEDTKVNSESEGNTSTSETSTSGSTSGTSTSGTSTSGSTSGTSTPATEAPASKPENAPVTDSPAYNPEASRNSFDDQMESLGYTYKDYYYQKPHTFAGKPASKQTCDNSNFYYTVSLGGGYSFGNVGTAFSVNKYVTYSEDFVFTYGKGTRNFMDTIFEFYVFDSLPIPWGCSEDEYISTLVKCCQLDLSVLELRLRLFYRAYNVVKSASPEEEGYDYLYNSIMGGSVNLEWE